jgi:hypothetical protein
MDADLYGPCEVCVGELRARCAAAVREVEAPEYVPKVNVTANAVAQRADD